MLSFVVRLIVNGLAIWVATELVDGVTLSGESTSDDLLTLLLVAVIFAAVNLVIKPIVKLLSFPFFVITLGLFTFIVNAFMLWLTSWIASLFDLPFEVEGFWWEAVLGSVVISLVSWVLNLLLPD